MACCYIAASMIAFIINSCEALDINLNLQYNESVKHDDEEHDMPGYESSGKIEKTGFTILSISGMTCAACTTTVEKALLEIKGVEQALVSLALQEARVFHEPSAVQSQLVKAVENAGYDASVGERSSQQKIATLRHTEELQMLRTSLRGLVLFSTLIFGLGHGADFTFGSRFFSHPALALPRSAVLLGLTAFGAWNHGGWIFQKASHAALKAQINMHTLISASTIVGLLMTGWEIVQGLRPRYFDSIVGVLLIVTVGRYMDLLSRRRATDTFTGLYSLMDETSWAKLTSVEVSESFRKTSHNID
jgi:P-type Cu+ transporter